MAKQRFTARQFLVGSFAAVALFCVIVTAAAAFVAIPWGGADQAVRDALPPAQGESRTR